MSLRGKFIIVLIVSNYFVQAQPLQSTLLQRLIDANEPTTSIYTPSLTGLFPDKIDKRYYYNEQYLVKTDRHLYLGIAGTGFLYELIPVSYGVFDIKRVDSTVYAGNNFCAANFTFDSVVYSFGGYGFWKTNGTLKQYNPYSREWDVVPLLEERSSTFCQGPSGIYWKSSADPVPDLKDFNTAFAPSFFWVDPTSKRFFMGAQHVINEALADTLNGSKSRYNAQVAVLDVKEKRWSTLGDLLKYGWHYTIQLPWGLLVIENSESVYLADFNNNRLLYTKTDLLPLFRKFFKNGNFDVFFYANGYIYLGNPAANTIDSISIKLSDFNFTGEMLYKERTNAYSISFFVNPFYTFTAVAGLLIAIFVAIILIRKNRITTLSTSPLAAASISTTERMGLLSETEVALIQLLVTHSVKGRKTTIEEVNKLAGVAQKNEPIRRRVRSELINSINEKWIIITGSRDRLITSVKSSFDGRTREYHIVEKWLASPLLIQLSKTAQVNQ